MKTKGVFPIFTGVLMCLAFFSGCMIEDTIVTYNGPTTLSSDAQTVTYKPTKKVTTYVYKVSYSLHDENGEGVFGDGQYVAGGSDHFQFDFFSVTIDGGDIILDINENTTEYKRRIDISTTASSKHTDYDPHIVTIYQLPYGQSPED
ncbi:MAG: hypothetical protein LUD72_06455 [Bacteroidales bacterium]|nr:hypothetical protein [Bacteroidales bacterium]